MAAGPVEAPSIEVAGEVALGGRADVGDDLVLERQHALRAAIQAQARLGRLHSPSRAVEGACVPSRFSRARTCSETAGCVTPARSRRL